MRKFHISPHITETSFDNSIIFLNSQTNTYYALNDSAADFWKILKKTGSFEDALEEVFKLYNVPYESIKKDMEELLNYFFKAGIIEK